MAIHLRLGVIATACALSLATPAAHSAFAQNERPKAQPRTETSPPAGQAARRESGPAREAPARESAPPRERAVPRESPPPRETRQSAPRSEAPESRRASTPRETSSTSGRTVTREPSADNTNDAAAASGDQAVPRSGGGRPRDGRAATARAVPRDTVRREPRQTIIYYPRRDYPYGYGGYGLGYFYYDPYSWGPSYYPGYYSGYGYGYPGYGAYGGYDNSYGYERYGRYGSGAIRLKVKPRQAEVYVDGYYVGRVDDFDGVFQRLTLEVGAHRIDIREPGLQPLSFDVRIRPGETITYDGDLRKLR